MNRTEHDDRWWASPPRPRAGRTPRGLCGPGVSGALALLLAVACIEPSSAAAGDELTDLHQWQLRRLFEPTERERKHERQGNVYIYEGLTDRDVEDAMSREFGRIEYMMFLGTLQTAPDGRLRRDAGGQPTTESPGCDD